MPFCVYVRRRFLACENGRNPKVVLQEREGGREGERCWERGAALVVVVVCSFAV